METATENKPWVSENISDKGICNLIKHLRTNVLKMELDEFAKKAGLPIYRISNWEAHKMTTMPSDKISLGALRKIADAFGFEAEIILTKK